jgi:hypothetical protein
MRETIHRQIRIGRKYRHRDADDIESDVLVVQRDTSCPGLWIVQTKYGDFVCVSEDSLGAEVNR